MIIVWCSARGIWWKKTPHSYVQHREREQERCDNVIFSTHWTVNVSQTKLSTVIGMYCRCHFFRHSLCFHLAISCVVLSFSGVRAQCIEWRRFRIVVWKLLYGTHRFECTQHKTLRSAYFCWEEKEHSDFIKGIIDEFYSIWN